jgi:hypothetical protein
LVLPCSGAVEIARLELAIQEDKVELERGKAPPFEKSRRFIRHSLAGAVPKGKQNPSYC